MCLLPAFLEIGSLVFLIFGTKVQNGNAQNVTEPDFRKKFFLGKFGPKLPKNRVFWTLCKIASLVFSDFWQKNRVQGTLKCGRNNLSLKIFFRRNLQIFVFWGNSPLPFSCYFDYSC